MDVVVSVPQAIDFNSDSGCSTPFMTAPSSPQPFGNIFLGASTSHTTAWATTSFDGNDRWIEESSFPKSNDCSFDGDINEDFEFSYSRQLDRTSLSADELFDGGKIKPLVRPPPGIHVNDSLVLSSNMICSPRPKIEAKKSVQEVPSPRRRKYFGQFEASLKGWRELGIDDDHHYPVYKLPAENEWSDRNSRHIHREHSRGRSERIGSSFSLNVMREESRSLSPLRSSDVVLEEEDKSSNTNPTSNSSATRCSNPSTSSSILSLIPFSKGYRKWSLKNFLLFRSASEGRATDKDPLKKYTMLSKKVGDQDAKNSSLRANYGVGSMSIRKNHVSAHELNYTANRAVSKEMKRKTYLPYKQGLLGCSGCDFQGSFI